VGVLALSDKEKIIITILSVIGFYTAIFKFIEIDEKYFNGNLFISCILILLILGFLFAGFKYLFHTENKNERLVGAYYCGLTCIFGWLFYIIVLS